MDILRRPGRVSHGDYVEIMNKASSLSLVCNAVLYWNTIKIGEAVDGLREQGEDLTDEDLSHISLLPYRHVLPARAGSVSKRNILFK